MASLLFVGGMFPKNSDFVHKNSKGNVQNAANVLQWGIVEGLKESEAFRLSLASALFVGSYPKRFRKLLVKGAEETQNVDYIPFLNLPVIKNISRYRSVRKFVRKWLKEQKEEELYILAYSAHTPFIRAIAKEKKTKNFHFHLIVPDLPQFMNLSTDVGMAYKILKKIDISLQNRCLKEVDSFTFLTEAMNKAFNHYGKPYTVVEGMVDVTVKRQIENIREKEKTIVYTGTLEKKYGILNLVHAMEYVKSDVKLILCGKGDAEEEILEVGKKNSNIDYRGIVKYEEALKLQGRASLLVNPRPDEEEYTKYSFPSKNLEYMLWNKPVLVYKLSGIPKEYDEVLLYFSSTEPEKMAETIDEILRRPKEELEEIGRKTTKFALEEKNYQKQTKKMIQCFKAE